MFSRIAAIIALFALGPVLSVGVLRAEPLPITTDHGVVYSTVGERELRLDVARPKTGGPYPAVVCFHGGGWMVGSREDLSRDHFKVAALFSPTEARRPALFEQLAMRVTASPQTPIIEQLAQRGYVVASVTYRLAPKAKFPAQIHDAKAAVRFMRAHHREYGLDPSRVVALGFSAGGHLACLLGVTTPEDGLEGNGGNADQDSAVQAVVSFFGPTDLANLSPADRQVFAEDNVLLPFLGVRLNQSPEAYRRASPVHYVRRGAPPFLFFHGGLDPIVGWTQTHRLADNLSEVGTPVRVIEFPERAHGWYGEPMNESVVQTADYLDRLLKGVEVQSPSGKVAEPIVRTATNTAVGGK